MVSLNFIFWTHLLILQKLQKLSIVQLKLSMITITNTPHKAQQIFFLNITISSLTINFTKKTKETVWDPPYQFMLQNWKTQLGIAYIQDWTSQWITERSLRDFLMTILSWRWFLNDDKRFPHLVEPLQSFTGRAWEFETHLSYQSPSTSSLPRSGNLPFILVEEGHHTALWSKHY